MKKVTVFFMALSLFSCKKENLKEDSTDSTDNSTPCTLKLELAYSPINQLNYCRFTYTDINGLSHYNQNEMDRQVEDVDFSKPVKVTASAGVTFYDPVNGPLYEAQLANYQLKKDGVVIDVQSVVSYVYEN